jgi:hypothetical protein
MPKKLLDYFSAIIFKSQNFIEEHCDPWRSGNYVSVETSGSDHALMQCHAPEERNPALHRWENLKALPVSLCRVPVHSSLAVKYLAVKH